MKANKTIVCFFLCLLLCVNAPARALKLPSSLKTALSETLPIERIRLDGAVETKAGALYLPLLPTEHRANQKKITLQKAYPDEQNPEFFLLDNGWCFLRVLKFGQEQTVIALKELPANLQKSLLATRFASDLIVPEHFVLPPSLKPLAKGMPVTIKEIATKESEGSKGAKQAIAIATGHQPDFMGESKNVSSKSGWILVTSPATGKISLFSFPELSKVMEFPMEGTPSGIAFALNKVYISDQSKGRVLKLDPYHKCFLGQIDLPKRCGPKDVVALSNGKLIYVSESMFNDIAVIETDSDKLLLRTKVNNCPGRMAITPNGNVLLVISVSEGKVSLLSTQNQRFLGTIKVGSLPNGIAFSADSRFAYVSNRVSNTVSVLDLVHQANVQNITTGAGPTGLALDADHGRLYVANAKDNSITIFDLKGYKKIDEIKLPMELDFIGSLTLLPDKKHILVSSESTESLGLFDIASHSFEKIVSVGHTSDQCLWVPGQE